MNKIISVFSFVLLYMTMAFGQAAIDITVTVTDNASGNQVLNFGLDPTATDVIDFDLGESNLPPPPPGNAFDARWWLPPFAGALSSHRDYRNAPAFPFSGNREHVIKFQSTNYPITVSWNLPPEIAASSTIRDPFNLQVLSFSGTGSIIITNTAIGQVNLSIDYANIGPIDPGPVFSVNPMTLNFGNVAVGNSSTQGLTVSNLGGENALTISTAGILNTDYEVVPNPATTFPIVIAAGGSYNFDVTFTPTSAGISTGDVEFVHDAPGSPSSVDVTGNGTTQGGDLVFDPQTRAIFDNAQGYSSSVRLENYVGTGLKALQFKIVLDGLLIFRSIERGSNVPAGNWNFSYTIAEGSYNPDGSRNDTIKVVILGNGNNQLEAGNDYELAVFEYDAVNISTESEQTTVHFEGVVGGTGEPEPGQDAQVTAGPAQEITINNRVIWGDVNFDDRVDILDLLLMIDYILDKVEFTEAQLLRGDVAPWTSGTPAPTGDGVVNAIDLALLQNIILTGQYPSGQPATKPVHPGTIVEGNDFYKLNPGDEAQLTFYITESGVSVVLESIVNVKGLQVELSKVTSLVSGMNIYTVLGNGYYHQSGEVLRTLVYDSQGQAIEPGEYLFLNMPFTIGDPREVKIDNVVLASEDNSKIDKLTIQVIYGNAPQLPTEYSLSQNYPNPFNPTTEIQFTVPNSGNVQIVIYNMLGQEVRTLFTGHVQRGTYRLQWDGQSNSGIQMSSGNYIYRMTSGDFVQSKKMMLIK